MKKARKIIALAVAMVMIFTCTAGASDGKEACLNVTTSVYKAFPGNMTIKKGETDQISQVVKFQFKYKGKDSFESVEKFLKGIGGTVVSKSSMKWVSSNTKTVEVSSAGKIEAVSKGKAYVYPVPKGVTTYKTVGKYIFYLKGGVSNGVRVYGGVGTKIKVTK